MEIDIPAEIRAKYLQRREKDLRDCRLAFQNSNYDVFIRVGHQLKGNAITFGYGPLSSIGERLELSGRSQDKAQMQLALVEFETYIQSQISP